MRCPDCEGRGFNYSDPDGKQLVCQTCGGQEYMSKPYPGIPAGILDEDLEEYMNEKGGPFDAAIDAIRNWQRVIEPYAEMHIEEIANLEEAVHVLLDWPKWEPLIKAAGRVNKRETLSEYLFARSLMTSHPFACCEICHDHRALLESLPEPGREVEEEPKRYRCESCGKDFDKKLFSHSRTEENQMGEPVEVECGPITEVK